MISDCEARGSREVTPKAAVEACSRNLLKQIVYANQWSCRVYIPVDNAKVDMKVPMKKEEKKKPEAGKCICEWHW